VFIDKSYIYFLYYSNENSGCQAAFLLYLLV